MGGTGTFTLYFFNRPFAVLNKKELKLRYSIIILTINEYIDSLFDCVKLT
jgi:hypothetical protein